MKKLIPSFSKKVKNIECKNKFTFLTGPNKGNFFYLKKKDRLVIGRDDSCNISLRDSNISREHAELVSLKDKVVITDLMSQNGIIVNDIKTLQSDLIDGDKIIVGKHIIKFQQEKILSSAEAENKKPVGLVPILAIFLCITWILFDSDEPGSSRKISSIEDKLIKVQNKKLERKINTRELKENRELNVKINNILKRGLRELREKNYFRAISEFNQALDISPNDAQANFYLRKSLDSLDKVVQQYNIEAQRDIASLKNEKAVISYCAIIRLLHNYSEDERYKSAYKNIEKIEESLGREKGSTICLQE